MFFSKKKPHMVGCLVCHIVVSILLFLTTIGSLGEVIQTHYIEGKVVFGSASGALAFLAFGFSVTLWMHAMKCCMGPCDVCGTMKK